MKISDIKIGMSYEMKRSFSDEEVRLFAELSYDTNPLHLDVQYAENSLFGKRIVPGFLTASLFSAIIGTRFPGEGSIYLSQNMKFIKPVFLNQMVVAKVVVTEIDVDKNRVLLETCCSTDDGILLIEGQALVKLQNPKE